MSDSGNSGQRSVRENGVWHTQYDWSSTLPSEAVVEAVAAAADCEPMALDPLYDYVDPDALDAIIQKDSSNSSGSMITVVFTLADYEVTVYTDGEVAVRAVD